MSRLAAIGAIVAVLALAGFAGAATIEYTVSGVGPTNYPGPVTPPAGSPHLGDGLGYPGDAVGFVSYTGTLDLTPGTSVQKINTLTWGINYTYAGTADDFDQSAWTDLSLGFAAARTISFGGESAGDISQAGLVNVTWLNDYLTIDAGATSTFFVPGYRIDVTPLGTPQTGGTNFDGDPTWIQPDQDVMARFDVTAVPEPVTMALMAIGSLVAMRRRRA